MQYFVKPGKMGYAFPVMRMTQVPNCCSAENLTGINSYGAVYDKNVDNTPKTDKDPSDMSDWEKIDAIKNTYGCLSREGAYRMCAFMLAHRICKCENPYIKRLNTFPHDKGRIDGYYWPSRIWTMYDRTDVQRNEALINTQNFGEWMEENSQEMGIETNIIEGESVHALSSDFSHFGSDKPNGYGTIRVWVLIVRDMKQLDEWRENTKDELLSQLTLKKGDNTLW